MSCGGKESGERDKRRRDLFSNGKFFHCYVRRREPENISFHVPAAESSSLLY
jgi:hypothetical protein